jgi:Ni2+-binding GTPase involved in maturation of urease and hydrogenase
MKIITVSGTPSSGKTAVIIKTLSHLIKEQLRPGVVKFDCLATFDDQIYEKENIPVLVGLSGNLCPDHFFITNIESCVDWALKKDLDILVAETAGLCNRCSPHIKQHLAVCVIDNLMGIDTPKKVGPMLKLSDVVVVTKGDIVSQAEREVFSFKIRQSNPKARIFFINGITGQGSYELAKYFTKAQDGADIQGQKLRFPMPAAICSYCLGETRIGPDFQHGNVKKMNIVLPGITNER